MFLKREKLFPVVTVASMRPMKIDENTDIANQNKDIAIFFVVARVLSSIFWLHLCLLLCLTTNSIDLNLT